jgi:hypothetical protein
MTDEIARAIDAGTLWRDQRDDLRVALKKLLAEIHATLSLSEPELRAIVGNTNVTCLKEAAEEAKKLI